MSSTRRRTPALGLPSGWMREECVRQTGISRGKSDVYYLSPSGKKVRSKPELIRLLGSSCDLSAFDYRSGKTISEKTKTSRGYRTHDIKLFREKRLSGLKAIDTADAVIETMDLPDVIQAIGSRTTSEELLQRIATHLHQSSTPVTGQTSPNVAKDPCVWLNAQQPICKSFKITEDDIRKQEFRVLAARERLERAIAEDKELQRKELMILV